MQFRSAAADDSVEMFMLGTEAQQHHMQAQSLNCDIQRLTMRFGGPTKGPFKVRKGKPKDLLWHNGTVKH